MRRLAITIALAAAGVALAACGADVQTGSAGGVVPATVTGTGDPTTAPTALDFEAPLIGGGSLDFRTLNGSTVALWFWAPT
jgi:ABC-type glycerol-3-phosphate transport system substrate-binding protein